jgi:hypothetical protein
LSTRNLPRLEAQWRILVKNATRLLNVIHILE